MKQRVIGLISGTSVDGIDAALVEIAGSTADLEIQLLAGATYPYPQALRSQILAVCGGATLSMAEFAALDDAIAQTFAQAALTIQAGHPAADLIGSHGQTVYHRPPGKAENSGRTEETERSSAFNLSPSALGYSLQLGRGALIAHLSGIPTVSNFRAADIAAGGQGAPLVSAVDVCLFTHPTYNRCVQNIGGIGNVTYLPALAENQDNQKLGNQENRAEPKSFSKTNRSRSSSETTSAIQNPLRQQIGETTLKQPASSHKIVGWDTGPGNALLDLAVQHFSGNTQTYDQDGAWAAQGTPCQELVQQWLQQDFFQQLPPKSTGRELFGCDYLDRCLAEAAIYSLSNADVLATLTELTAASIAHSYRTFLPQLPDQVLLCGGGSRNPYLKQRLEVNLNTALVQTTLVQTTDDLGLNADYKEAIAFATLAYWRNCGIPGNLPEVTGAKQSVLLGEIHLVA